MTWRHYKRKSVPIIVPNGHSIWHSNRYGTNTQLSTAVYVFYNQAARTTVRVRDRGEKNMSKITGFLAGMMSGALVGTVTALLLAPMSGRELQVRAREEIDNLVDDAKTAAETKRVQLEAQLEAMKAPKTPETEIA
jgi:hypothetical protein